MISMRLPKENKKDMFHAVYIECCYVVQIKIEKKKETRRGGGGPLLIDVTFCLGQTLVPSPANVPTVLISF